MSDADRDVPGSGTGWDQIQYGGMTAREAADMANSYSTTPSVTSGYPGDYPGGGIGRADTTSTGKGSALYPILVLGAVWLLLYYTGLIHTAFSTVPNFLKSGAIVGGAIFLLTKKGKMFAMFAFAALFLGMIGIFALTMAGAKMGFLKPVTPPANYHPYARAKHHPLVKIGHKMADDNDFLSH